jgi:acetolactate synthase-1/3 small subunit
MGEPGTKEVLSLDQLEAVAGLRTGRKHILSILSRITLTLDGAVHPIDQVTKQLHKLVNVLKIRDLEPGETLARELALFKVNADGAARAEVMQICEIFRAKIVDVTKRSVVIEVTGTFDKVDAFEALVRPFGLIEMARTGEIALSRGRNET